MLSVLCVRAGLHGMQDLYDVREMIGHGTSGEVRRAINRTTGKQVAVKVRCFSHPRCRSKVLVSCIAVEAAAPSVVLPSHETCVRVRLDAWNFRLVDTDISLVVTAAVQIDA